MQHLKKFSSHPKFDKGRRKQIFAKILKMSTEGKESVLKLLLILGLLIFPQTVSISPSTLRGGLVYQEKTTQGPVYVNVETITLIRKADTTDLLNSARTSRSMINTYQNFCRKVANRVTIFDTPRKPTRAEVAEPPYVHPFDIHFSPFKYPIMDAPQVCKEMGGRRPEIRDKQSMEAIRFAAITKGVVKISAGIQYDSNNNVFRYISDDVNARYQSPFSFLEYGGYYIGQAYRASNWEDEYAVQSYADKYPIIYNHPEKEFVIRLGDANDKGFKDYIMCEVPKSEAGERLKEENNLILQVTDHACKRDAQGLVASTNIIINEIEAITNLNVTLPEEIQTMDHFFPQVVANYDFDEDKKKRRKRSAGRKLPRFNRLRPAFISAILPKEKTPERELKRMEEDIGHDEAGPVLLSMYHSYRTMQKAKYPSTPLTFDKYLMRNAMEEYYKVVNDSYFGDIYSYKIEYHDDMPPIMNYDETAIKRAYTKTMDKEKLKTMVRLFKKYSWFKDLVFDSTKSDIIPYLQLSKINGMTRWEIFAKITQKVKDDVTYKRRSKRETHVNPYLAQLYNIYAIRSLAKYNDPSFQGWIRGKAVVNFYATKENHAFYAKYFGKIHYDTRNFPIVTAPMEDIQKEAQKMTSQAALKAQAKLYKEEPWYREETDRKTDMFVRIYLIEDLYNGEPRGALFTKYTNSIKKEEINASRPRTTRPTTTTTTTTSTTTTSTTTTPTTTQKSQKRTRRTPIGPLALLGVGLGSAAAVNAISSSITGDAPLSWGGKTMGSLFGLKTAGRSDFQVNERLGQALEDLKVNNNELVSSVNLVTKQMTTVTSALNGHFKSTATMVMEQDIKMYIRHILLVQEDAIQKYAHIMLAASLHQVSPYALSQKELDKTADELKMKKGIILVRDLTSSRCEATIVDGELFLQIEIPIINEANLFNFYQIKPVPIFIENATMMPVIDSTVIAISKTGSDYAIVTPEELATCTNTPWKCQLSTPIIPMSQNSHCVASTYITQHLTCPVKEVQEKIQPFFHLDLNHTIFSVPTEMRAYVKCSENNLSNKYKDEAIILKGMGEAVFKHSCTITLPNGAKFTTPAAKTAENTANLKIFELLRVYPVPTGVIIDVGKPQVPIINTTELTLSNARIPTKEELTYDSFHPSRSIPFLIQMACVIAFMITAILIIRCCWPNIRAWLGRTWYCCCWGPTPEEEQKQRQEENAKTFQRLTEELDNLRLQATKGAERWKQSSSNLWNNLQKARSLTNLKEKDSKLTNSYQQAEESLLHSEEHLPPPPPPLTPTIKHTRIVYKADPANRHVSFSKNDE